MMKKILILMLAVVMMAPLVACKVEQTEEGEMPEVEVKGGNMPEYDVDAADVTVGTKEKTITVPDVDIQMPDEEDDPDFMEEEENRDGDDGGADEEGGGGH